VTVRASGPSVVNIDVDHCVAANIPVSTITAAISVGRSFQGIRFFSAVLV
jgi:hypothetical protein